MAYVRTYAKRGPPRWRYPTIYSRSLNATTPGPALRDLLFYYELLCGLSEGMAGCDEALCYRDYINEYQNDASDRTGTNMNHCNCTSEGPAFDYVMYNNKRGYLYIYWGMGARDIAP